MVADTIPAPPSFLSARLLVWLGAGFLLVLSGCVPGAEQLEPPAVRGTETAAATLAPPTLTPTAAPEVVAAATTSPTPTATPTPSPSITPTQTRAATATPAATGTPTPVPTPHNLPPAPRGWRWELFATGIPVTHYIVYELAAEAVGPFEVPYGLDDAPLPGLEPLPRAFLEQTAYQGSGRLPSGDVLQYAAVRPPVEPGLVPYRYVITPAERCGGHPVAGNRTCSVPLETAATTWREENGPLVPVGSTIFVPELDMKLRINDVAITEGPHKIDLYTGTINNYDYERPDGAAIWLLVEE